MERSHAVEAVRLEALEGRFVPLDVHLSGRGVRGHFPGMGRGGVVARGGSAARVRGEGCLARYTLSLAGLDHGGLQGGSGAR